MPRIEAMLACLLGSYASFGGGAMTSVLSKRRRKAGLAAALVLAAGFVAIAPRATLAATYFSDTFNQPSPSSADWVVYNAENLPSAAVDTGVGTADRSFGLLVEPFDGNPDNYHQSYSCAGSNCPVAGDTAWHLHFDPAFTTATGTSETDTGVAVETQYVFSSPANFTGAAS